MACLTLPTLWSNSIMQSPYPPMRELPLNSSEGRLGKCGLVMPIKRKNGSPDCEFALMYCTASSVISLSIFVL